MVSIICLSECYNELKGDIGGSKQKEVFCFFFQISANINLKLHNSQLNKLMARQKITEKKKWTNLFQ